LRHGADDVEVRQRERYARPRAGAIRQRGDREADGARAGAGLLPKGAAAARESAGGAERAAEAAAGGRGGRAEGARSAGRGAAEEKKKKRRSV
jgi:hypothetical protein